MMIKKLLKKAACVAMALTMVAGTVVALQPTEASAYAIPAKSVVRKAYRKYVYNYLGHLEYSQPQYPNGRYKFYDLDKDGIEEMFFQWSSGSGYGYKVYTYRKSDGVRLVKNITSTGRSLTYKGKNIRVVTKTSGVTTTTYWRLNLSKMLKYAEYKAVQNSNGTVTYYKDGNQITWGKYATKTIDSNNDYVNMFLNAKKVQQPSVD